MCADLVINNSPTSIIGSFRNSTKDPFQKMQERQDQIDPYFSQINQSQPLPLCSFSPEAQKEATDLLDQIYQKVGYKPLSQRLVELHARISEVAEKYFLTKLAKEQENKEEIQGNIQDQKSWKGHQAFTHSFGGGAILLLNAIALLTPGDAGNFLKDLANSSLTSSVESIFTKFIDGQLIPLSHDQQLYLNSVQSDKQSTEGIKNALQQLLQLALEVERQETQNFASIAQQR